MRVLVTGCAGYIGSACTAVAIDAGHQVTVFDNLVNGHRRAVHEKARVVVGDLLEPADLAAALADGFDAVMHFAALIAVAESGWRRSHSPRGSPAAGAAAGSRARCCCSTRPSCSPSRRRSPSR